MGPSAAKAFRTEAGPWPTMAYRKVAGPLEASAGPSEALASPLEALAGPSGASASPSGASVVQPFERDPQSVPAMMDSQMALF